MADPEVYSDPGMELEVLECFRCSLPGEALYKVGSYTVRQCTECDQAFTSPKPNDESLRKMYDSGYRYDIFRSSLWRIHAYRAMNAAWAEARLDLIEGMIGSPDRPPDELEIFEGDECKPDKPALLEIGVPLGAMFLYMAGDRGFSMHGHQYSKTTARLIGDAFGAAIHDGTVEEAKLPDANYDAVCSWDVIEHVPDPAALLKEMCRMAKPGAAIAISCPNFDSLPQKILKDRWWTLKPGEHLWHFTPETLSLLFDEAGIPIKELIKSPLHPANLGRLDSMVAVAQKDS